MQCDRDFRSSDDGYDTLPTNPSSKGGKQDYDNTVRGDFSKG
jgi:hypothetical protein